MSELRDEAAPINTDWALCNPRGVNSRTPRTTCACSAPHSHLQPARALRGIDMCNQSGRSVTGSRVHDTLRLRMEEFQLDILQHHGRVSVGIPLNQRRLPDKSIAGMSPNNNNIRRYTDPDTGSRLAMYCMID